MKLIIEIEKEEFDFICKQSPKFITINRKIIADGIPLGFVKAEIQSKEMVETDTEKQFYNMALGDVLQILDNIGNESEE